MRFRIFPRRPYGYHRWFAWRPVWCSSGEEWVWWEYVSRNFGNARRYRYSRLLEREQ